MEGIYAPIMTAMAVVVKDLHWESHLVKNLELREDTLVLYQVKNLRVQYYESRLIQNLELV